MKSEQRLKRVIKGLSYAVIAALFLQISPIYVRGQARSDSFLTRLASRTTNNFKVAFAFSPKFPTAGQTVQFTDASTGNPGSWLWDFGDGITSTDKNPIHIFTTSGFRKVTLVAANGTSSKRATKTVTVMPESSGATFVFSPSTPGPGQTVQFADTSSGNPTSWQWDFGDGSTSSTKNPNHAFIRAGSYIVSLVVGTSLGTKRGTNTLRVAEVSTLTPSFTCSPTLPVIGQSIQFTDTSTGTPASWSWNFGDGSTSTAQNPVHAYSTAGSKTVTLSVANSSSSNAATRTVTVVAALTASFAFSPSSPVAGQAVQFTDTSTGTPTSWSWNFGDGSTSTAQNPTHAYSTAGSKTVTLTVRSSSGSNAATRTVSVVAVLTASFVFSPVAPVAGQAVQFTDTSMGSPTLWQWNFNDGATSTSQNPSHAFTAAGSYTISLSIMSASGQASTSRTITVSPVTSVTASFSFSPSSPTANQSVRFVDTSSGTPTSWQWSFGDGSTSMAQNPVHAYATTGTYTVDLIVSNSSNSSTVSRTVAVVAASTLIPADRLVDWSRAGVWVNGVKGIPAYPVGITMQNTNAAGSYYIRPNDTTAATANLAAFNTAIAACPLGRAVLVPAGRYCVNGTIVIERRVVLRGVSPETTTISCINGSTVVQFGGGMTFGNATGYYDVLSGFGKGSSNLVVRSTDIGHFVVGGLVRIDQLNDPNLVTSMGVLANCGYCGRDGLDGTRAVGEIARVIAISGNTITLNRPLHYDYKAAYLPQICPGTGATPLENAGLENLHITFETAQSAGSGVQLNCCVGCWVKRCEVTNFHYNGIYPRWGAYACEIRENYVHHPSAYGSGQGYGMRIFGYVCDSLFEDNIIHQCHAPIDIDTGGAGNVFAYNYAARCYPANNPEWMLGGINCHGAHPYMNLFEGNYMEQMSFDNYHGSSSHGMIFRNYVRGTSFDGLSRYNLRALVFDRYQRYFSSIGNVLGSEESHFYEIPTPYTSDTNIVIYKRGYQCCSAPGTPYDPLVVSTMLVHGNYDFVNAAVVWDPLISERAIPDSLYLETKPEWFGVLDWPPYTPERSGFNPGSINKIPAQVRFESGLPWATSRGY